MNTDWLWREMSDQDLHRPAVVFSPHPDDETLGCGGTIIRKRDLGVPVRIVFMTDGRHSHTDMAPADLAARRAAEALSAAEVLGVPAADVTFLSYEDGTLASHADDAIARIRTLLTTEQLFVPCAYDGQPDHEATFRIVAAAAPRACSLWEYPVWLWSQRSRHLRLLRDFTTRVPITSYARKLQALFCYATQMTPLTPTWPTLHQVSNGRWLPKFFGPSELFRQHR